MSDDEIRARICKFLQAHNTLSLGTAAGDVPWSASVFYVNDDALNLYFLTDPKTRHGRGLDGARVSGTVNEDCRSWMEIRGLQVSGVARLVGGEDREAVLKRYFKKFAELEEMRSRPANDQEELIVGRLSATPFFQITPRWIRLIDNSVHFGFKQELELA